MTVYEQTPSLTQTKTLASEMSPDIVLSVEDLSVQYLARRGAIQAVRGVSFELRKGESLALIGESGCGKTTLATSLIRLLPRMATFTNGEIRFQRRDRLINVLQLGERDLRLFRWQECAMVFQGAQNALNPVLSIAKQFQDTAAAHGITNRGEIDQRARVLLQRVQLDPNRVLGSYPFELSGGMRQRVLIALALLLQPDIIILDEPTTALDVLTQRNIIDLLNTLRVDIGFTLLFVSHDLAMAAELADRVATMYAGRIIELGTVEDIFQRPRHPYTYGLLQATPTLHDDVGTIKSIGGTPPDLIDLPSGCPFHPRCKFAERDKCTTEEPPLIPIDPAHSAACWFWPKVEEAQAHSVKSEPAPSPNGGRPEIIVGSADAMPSLIQPTITRERGARVIQADGVSKVVHAKAGDLPIVTDVSFDIAPGEVLCLVGESGCGKTTTGKLIAGLIEPTGGTVRFEGVNIRDLKGRDFDRYRRSVQIIHQDPYASLNPSMSVYQTLSAPLKHYKMARGRNQLTARILELLERVDLTPAVDFIDKYPHQLSGGQRQRLVVARALTVEPTFIIADEAVAMLDVSIRMSLLQTLRRLQDDLGVAFIFITHDLSMARLFGWEGRIGVMYLGRIVELGPTPEILAHPQHPYTQALLSAVPEADLNAAKEKERVQLRSLDIPSLINVPRGCSFHPRCPLFEDGLCEQSVPILGPVPGGTEVACHVVMRRYAKQIGVRAVPATADLLSHQRE